MKTIILLFTMALTVVANANDGRYVEAMTKNIEAVYKAQSIEELQSAVNGFDRIANAEKTKWEPSYYSAFGYVMMATREKDNVKKDSYLDLATSSVEKAKAISENESEIIAMEAFIYLIRLSVDSPSRGQKYSILAMQTLEKSLQANPENPRALMLLAQLQFGTAKFFGSPTTQACGTVTKALEKYETYKTDNPVAPRWGKQTTVDLKQNCQ
ncbi:MAG TPA: hypothetical protein VGQ59_18585 [Cyclobacteriaceae bacterium]|jgi:hypothetical protein|nr:hypothetical protein [Cyclobacteriaceae bacterium]